MPLPVYDTQDAVPEDQREDYVEHEGKWRTKVEVDLATERTKRAKLLNEKKEEERLRKEAETERDELKRSKEARESGITDEQLKKIKDDEAVARKPIEDERDQLKAENRKLKLNDRIEKEALDAGVFVEDLPLVMKELMYPGEERFELTKEGSPVVLGEDGQPTTKTLKDFFTKDYKALRPKFFEGSGASGSGAQGSSGSNGASRTPTENQQQVAEKRAAIAGAF